MALSDPRKTKCCNQNVCFKCFHDAIVRIVNEFHDAHWDESLTHWDEYKKVETIYRYPCCGHSEQSFWSKIPDKLFRFDQYYDDNEEDLPEDIVEIITDVIEWTNLQTSSNFFKRKLSQVVFKCTVRDCQVFILNLNFYRTDIN